MTNGLTEGLARCREDELTLSQTDELTDAGTSTSHTYTHDEAHTDRQRQQQLWENTGQNKGDREETINKHRGRQRQTHDQSISPQSPESPAGLRKFQDSGQDAGRLGLLWWEWWDFAAGAVVRNNNFVTDALCIRIVSFFRCHRSYKGSSAHVWQLNEAPKPETRINKVVPPLASRPGSGDGGWWWHRFFLLPLQDSDWRRCCNDTMS